MRLWNTYHKRPSREVRNRLVEAYQPFAIEIVRRFAARLPRSVDRGDLDTAANFGLIAAIEGFDPDRGVRFESYCELRIKGALLDELRKQDWLPRPWRTRVDLHKRAHERLTAEMNCNPSDEEMARELDMPIGAYRQMFGDCLLTGARSAVAWNGSSDDAMLAVEVVADPNGDSPGDKLTREELFRLATEKLSEQEYRVVYLKYWEERSMREIGESMHLSESRVCKIHARLLERLKDRLRMSAAEE